ncbi:MAG: AEC family transporter [Prolixibacteraceae bacterium]|nr:AEC family transporter [Prolixibacteraceae bacterium]
MSSFFTAFQSIGPLFLVIFVGMVISRNKSVNDQWLEVLNNYALWIGFPALILVALSRLQWDMNLYGSLMGWNSLRIVFSMLMVFPVSALFRLQNSTRRTLFLAVSYGNVAYLGIPVLRSAYGDQILPQATMISSVYIFWMFTLGIFLVEYFGDHKVHFRELVLRLVTNPLLIAVFIGLFITINHLQLPKVVVAGLDIFANSVTAIVLFSLGIFMGKQPIGKLRDWLPVLAFSFVILFVLPFLFMLVLKPYTDFEISKAWILEAAMPMGLTAYALCLKYKLNTGFASRAVVASTLLALLSLPFWLVFLK